MEKSITVRRDFKLQGIGIPETPIKPLFETSMIHDFKYSEEEISNEGDMKRVRRIVSYNNDTVKTNRYIYEMPNDENIPDVYKELKCFTGLNPFSKELWDMEWDLTDYNLGFTLLMFKLGYCDGVYCRNKTLNNSIVAKPIISVDPERRDALKKFTEAQWKDFLDQIDIKDFGWILMNEGYFLSYDKKWQTATEHSFQDCWDSSENDILTCDSSTLIEDDEFYKLCHEDRVAGISLIKYFNIVGGCHDTPDDYNCVPIFKTESAAKCLENILKQNYTQYNEYVHGHYLSVQPLSIKFQKFICDYNRNNLKK